MDHYGDETLNEAIDELIAHMARVEPDLINSPYAKAPAGTSSREAME